MYIASYIAKGDQGNSALLQGVAEAARGMDKTSREVVFEMGETFVQSQEICSQQAVFLATGMKTKYQSRVSKWVSTSPAEERCRSLKGTKQLAALDADSTDVLTSSPIDHFHSYNKYREETGKHLGHPHLCLADFMTWYNRASTCQASLESDDEVDNEADPAEALCDASNDSL